MPKLIKDEGKKRQARLAMEKLAWYYPEAETSLVYENPFQLFVATVLSAQTTDEQVNKITADLFMAVPTMQKMSLMKPSELEPYLKSGGLYRNKSRFLIESSRMIVEKHGGRVPEDFEKLIKLPGVGRKTANVIISSAFGKPALAVDTHVFRVSKRLGLAEGSTVELVEEQLKTLIPVREWSTLHHRLIAHGRKICKAQNPKCDNCFLKSLCIYAPERGDNN